MRREIINKMKSIFASKSLGPRGANCEHECGQDEAKKTLIAHFRCVRSATNWHKTVFHRLGKMMLIGEVGAGEEESLLKVKFSMILKKISIRLCTMFQKTSNKQKKKSQEWTRRRRELARAFMLNTTIHFNNELPLCHRCFVVKSSIGRET